MNSDDREDFLLLHATHQYLIASAEHSPVFALTRSTVSDSWTCITLAALFGSDEVKNEVVFVLKDTAAQSSSLVPSWQLRNLLALLTVSKDMSVKRGSRYYIGSKVRVLAIRGVMISLDGAASEGDWKLHLGTSWMLSIYYLMNQKYL